MLYAVWPWDILMCLNTLTHPLIYCKSFKLIVTCLWAKKPSWITLWGRKTKPSEFFLHPQMKTPLLQNALLGSSPHEGSTLAPFERKRRESRNPLNCQGGSEQHNGLSVRVPSERVLQTRIASASWSLVLTECRTEDSLRNYLPASHSGLLPSLFQGVWFLWAWWIDWLIDSVTHRLLTNPSAKLGNWAQAGSLSECNRLPWGLWRSRYPWVPLWVCRNLLSR